MTFLCLSCSNEIVHFNEEKLQTAIADIEEFKATIADSYIGKVQTEERDDKRLFDDALDLLSNGEYDKARDLLGNGAISKSAVDSANIVWTTFANLCKDKKYRKAYEYFNDKHNQGNLLVDYSGINVPLVAVCNVPPVAQCNVPPQKWLQ